MLSKFKRFAFVFHLMGWLHFLKNGCSLFFTAQSVGEHFFWIPLKNPVDSPILKIFFYFKFLIAYFFLFRVCLQMFVQLSEWLNAKFDFKYLAQPKFLSSCCWSNGKDSRLMTKRSWVHLFPLFLLHDPIIQRPRAKKN